MTGDRFDQSPLNGKPIKVEFQDDGKRRKDAKYPLVHPAKAATTVARWATSPGSATRVAPAVGYF